MEIIGGLDVHRSQITYDWIDSASAASSPRRRVSTCEGG
jgi:hypothetical protein